MWYDKTAMIVAAIGAINWGLEALNLNLITLIFGSIPLLVDILYYIVALAGIWTLIKVFK